MYPGFPELVSNVKEILSYVEQLAEKLLKTAGIIKVHSANSLQELGEYTGGLKYAYSRDDVKKLKDSKLNKKNPWSDEELWQLEIASQKDGNKTYTDPNTGVKFKTSAEVVRGIRSHHFYYQTGSDAVIEKITGESSWDYEKPLKMQMHDIYRMYPDEKPQPTGQGLGINLPVPSSPYEYIPSWNPYNESPVPTGAEQAPTTNATVINQYHTTINYETKQSDTLSVR